MFSVHYWNLTFQNRFVLWCQVVMDSWWSSQWTYTRTITPNSTVVTLGASLCRAISLISVATGEVADTWRWGSWGSSSLRGGWSCFVFRHSQCFRHRTMYKHAVIFSSLTVFLGVSMALFSRQSLEQWHGGFRRQCKHDFLETRHLWK